jgi:Excreted virulence factor EspC, type VII ESX diderm
MTMQPIHVSEQVMREVADQHEEVAEKIATARMASPDILAAVNSYGPIMHQVKAATADLLAQRDAALLQHDETHRNAAAGLRREATNFVTQDEINAERLRFEQ